MVEEAGCVVFGGESGIREEGLHAQPGAGELQFVFKNVDEDDAVGAELESYGCNEEADCAGAHAALCQHSSGCVDLKPLRGSSSPGCRK